MPTLLDQLGLPEPWQSEGLSLVAQIAGHPYPAAVPAMAAGIKFGPDERAIYMDEWKLILVPAKRQTHLYAVWEDPLEEHDVAPAHPQVVERMRATLAEEDARSAKLRARRGSQQQKVALSHAQYERLRALGYAQ